VTRHRPQLHLSPRDIDLFTWITTLFRVLAFRPITLTVNRVETHVSSTLQSRKCRLTDRHKLTVQNRPFTARANGQMEPRCSITSPPLVNHGFSQVL